MTLQNRIPATSFDGNELSDIWGYVKDGQEYAIFGSLGATYIYNVTNCGSPTLVKEFDDSYTSIWRDYKVYGDYAYGVCDGANCGLQIMNLNTLTQTTNNTLIRAHNIFIDEPNARMYAVGTYISGTSSRNNILIYDISNPGSPNLVKTFNPGKYTHDIYVEDNTLYCSHGYSNLGIYTYNPVTHNVTTVGTSSGSSGYNHSSWKHPYQDVLYLAEEVPIGRPMFIYNISNPASPSWNMADAFKDPLLGPTYTNNRPHNPFVNGDYLYISYYHDGLQVYDVTDPYNPERVAYFDTYYQNTSYSSYYGVWGTYPYLPSGCLLVADIDNGFYTLTIDDYKGYSEVGGDIFLKQAGAGIVFKDNSGSYRKVYLNNGSLTTSSAGAPSSSDHMLMESHMELGNDYGIIFTDATTGLRKKLYVDKGSIVLDPVLLPTGANLEITQGDFYLSRKNAGIILSDSGNCFKFFTDISGNHRTPSHPCIPD
ncbi:MAG: choice-of-anchor B family protein [Saprospiraceae bacterium]|nr:choice-of-anchor B family protein [Saprospiraceae bacterium]